MSTPRSHAGADRVFPIRDVVLGALLPSILFGIAIGMVLPIIPATSIRLGTSLAGAGFVAALLPIGKVLADLPAGALAARIGDGRAMMAASCLAMVALAVAAWSPNLIVLQVSIFALGVASAVFHLARHAYLTAITPPHNRARVLSTLGGTIRAGYLVGPLLTAAVVTAADLRPAFAGAAVCNALALLTLVVVRPRELNEPAESEARASLADIFRANRRVFALMGTATLLVGIVRGGRQVAIPLWGEHLGLDPQLVSLIFGLSGGLDLLLFYPAGKLMDLFGRLWVAVPSMVLIGIATALLTVTSEVWSVALVAALLGIGNGFGSGILMTLGADVAPTANRSAFLGIWRIFQDVGDGVGPLAIALAAGAGSLNVGLWGVGVLGLVAAGCLGAWVPEFSMHANRTSRRRAGLNPDGSTPS